jgi:tetratricopeptide (TPR) repeat protein
VLRPIAAAKAVLLMLVLLLAQAQAQAQAITDLARAAYVASMEGRKADALAAAQELAAKLAVEQVFAAGSSGWVLAPQYTALVRFGLWDELIALLPPDARLPGLNAGYLYARGVAFAARGQLAEAHEALADLERLGASGPADRDDGRGALQDLIAVAAPVVAARIAATELRNADAVRELEKAVAAEDRLAGDPGAGWFFPVRDLLGAQLLIAGRAAEAVDVYRGDLERHPRNGWALYGLAAALRAAGDKTAARRAEREFARVWEHADVRLLSSAFWFAGPDTTSCECQRQPADQGAGLPPGVPLRSRAGGW